MEPVPDALRKAGTARGVGGQVTGGGAGGSGATRSMLTRLLANPGGGGGVDGYNNWFAAVCGHYAKQYRTQRDAYEYHCWQAYELLRYDGSEPHPKKDADKTLESVWASEQRKDEAAQPKPDNGYLLGGGTVLLTPTRRKDGEEYVYDVEEYADFNLTALGVVEDDDANRTYDVIVSRKRQGDQRRAPPTSDDSDGSAVTRSRRR